MVFPDSLRHCEGIIDAMVSSYVLVKKRPSVENEKQSLLLTLRSRYPFMKDRKKKEIVEKCDDIKELIYEVLKIDLIDFDVKKSEPIKERVDEIIDSKLK